MSFYKFLDIYIKKNMKPLYTESEFNNAKTNDLLTCECYNCQKPFNKLKKQIKRELEFNEGRVKFCSEECYRLFSRTRETIKCSYCDNTFTKVPAAIKKSTNHFCSQSCSTSYNNKHKVTGNRRSKLEMWLEENLNKKYPNLKIDYNKSSVIGSELDIYIPSLNIAFELNGIFHYEPIFGVGKLNQIKNNDVSKSKACFDAKIDLCVIDTSQQKYVKPSTSQKYLDIIDNIIQERLLII